MDFQLLGPLEVTTEGQPLALGGQRQRGVLAVLLLYANQVVSTDRLIDEVWGERPPKAVDASVQNFISRLRSVLGRELIERRPPGYLLRVDPTCVDSLRFEHSVQAASRLGPSERAAALREALELWRGSPLADLTFHGSARIETARLDELRLAALELRINAELELGRHESLLPEIEALASRHPGRERLRYFQMLALYRSGRQRDALRAYHEARLELVEGFGLEPGEDLRALERMIISHDPSLRLVQPAPGGVFDVDRKKNAVALAIELVVAEGLSEESARVRVATSLTDAALIIERHGGVSQQLLPEDISAIFGTPRIHDDDTMRALRAATEIRRVLPTGIGARLAIDRSSRHALDTARGLLMTARTGDLLLGQEALRLVPRAVDVVPHGSDGCYRVLRFDPESEPFLRHLDTPLIGRDRELARLEVELASVLRDGAPRRVAVLGEAGIGKTRLVREFVGRAGRRFPVVTAHCVAYGEGADLLPLREILSQVGALETVLAHEADAQRVLAQLREPSLTEKSEIFWALRRLLEAVAQQRALIVVLEDVHAAESTFLDLVEYLAGWTAAPLLLISVARPELLEARPEWREGAILLGPLAAADLAMLATALPGENKDPASLAPAVDAAEGNPLFLEQILAAGTEGLPRQVPPTIEVLIESRLDRLPAEERHVLERASVVGRQFWRAAVEAASPTDERADVAPALMALVRRQLIHPERSPAAGEEGFRFHHVLIRDVVYAGIPEETRAQLHESVARSLTDGGADQDELVGYHLEQAALLQARTGSPATALAEEAGRRLGAAGLVALKRLDGPAGVDLLTRATALLADDRSRLELDWALATSVKFSGDPGRADELLEAVAEKAAGWDDARFELRAKIEQIWGRLTRAQLSVDSALDLLTRATAVFGATGDELGLGRAWHLTAAVEGVYRYHLAEAEQAAIRGGHHYERSGFGPGLTLAARAVSAHRGPTPVGEAIGCCEALLLEAPTPVWESFILPSLAALEAMDGRFDDARGHVEEARVRRQEFSDTATIVTSWSAIAAEIELLAGNPAQAETILHTSCETLRAAGEIEWLATNTAMLGEAQYRQQRFKEAHASSGLALAIAPAEHLTSLSVARRVHAKALARLGRHKDAVDLATQTLRLLEGSDVLDENGETLTACAEALALSGDTDAADSRWAEAVSMFEQKENAVSAERARRSRSATS